MDKDKRLSRGLLLLLLVMLRAPVDAATITVSTTADDVTVNGNCTLREAVIAANTDFAVDGCRAGSGTDTIVLPAGTYTLSLVGLGEDFSQTGDLDVHSDLIIRGAGATATFIDAGSNQEYLVGDRVIHVSPFGSLTLSGVTIRGGYCRDGGGILNAGELFVIDSGVDNNIASDWAEFCSPYVGGGGGGGILNTSSGWLVVERSSVSGNGAHGDGPSDTTLSGGGLKNFGMATISNSLFTGNFAADGGAIWNVGGLEVWATQISGNSARFDAAALKNLEEAGLNRTTISGNAGGNVIVNSIPTSVALLRIDSSTISGNQSYFGGGLIHNHGGNVYITSSTIADNLPAFSGAGIGGLGRTELRNTIVANPGNGGSPNGDCLAPIISLGNNLDRDGSCGLTSSGDLPNTDPLLGPLADNGGHTPTQSLLTGSPALDRIPATQCYFSTDQRGVARPQLGSCDIGAYEFSPAPTVTITTPPAGSAFVEGTSISFSGTAIDVESGNLTSGLTWSSNLGGAIGSGGFFSRVLAVGTHIVTASVADGGGLVGSSSITVVVRPAGTTESTFTSIGAEDGLVAESSETSSAGGFVDSTSNSIVALRIGDVGGDLQVKSVLSFDTSSIPDGATIVSATLRLRRSFLRGTNPFTTHGAALADIRQGGFGGSAALEPGDFQAVPTAAGVASLSNPAANGDWSEGTLNAAGLAMLNLSGLTQFRLYFSLDDDDDNVEDSMSFRSGNDGDPASRPQLAVTYSVAGGNTAPTVVISGPSNGSTFLAGTSIPFSGTATDTESGNLTSALTWTSSRDGGIGSGGSFSSVLSVGTHTVTASVNDSGGLQGSASIMVTVQENTAPNVTITSPPNHSPFVEGTSISFAGTAIDVESGNLTSGLLWSSDRDGGIGSGGSFSRVLSVGTHVVTASVTDGGALMGSSSIEVIVNPAGVPPPTAPTNLVALSPVTGRVDLQWTDTASSETGFEIGRGGIGQVPPDLTMVGSVGADVTSFSVTNCTDPGVSHHWYVRAVNAGGPSPWLGPVGKNCDGSDATTQATFTSIGAEDGLVAESSETSNAGGFVDSTSNSIVALRIGDVGGDLQVKTVLSFDTSSIPDGATIVSATLRLRRSFLRGTSPFTTHGAALVDIRQGGFGGNTALEPGDFQAVPTATGVASLSNPAANGDWSEGIVNAAGLATLNLSGPTQFRLYFSLDDDDDNVEDSMAFRSGNDSDPASRPQLVVTYSLVGGGNTSPTVVISAPSNGSTFVEGTSISFSGTATDTQSGDLTSGLMWISNRDGSIGSGGFFSRVLSVGTHVVTAAVTDSGGLQGSAGVTVTVQGNTPPTVTITSPPNGSIFVEGTSISFSGTATDTQSGDLTSGLMWISNRDGGIGNGGSFSSVLSVGTHVVTASVTDAGALDGLASITVVVNPAGGTTEGTFTSIGAEDGLVAESSETSNAGGFVDSTSGNVLALRIGDVAGDLQVKSVLSFDTSSIPDGATILSATLRLRRSQLRGTNPFTTHGSALVDIRQGAFGGNAALASGDFQAAPTAVGVALLSDPAANGNWAEGTLNAAGLATLNLSGLTQFRVYFSLDDDDDSIEDSVAFRSGNDSDASSRPQLIVVYQP